MTDFERALDLVVSRTGHERYRYLCLEHPDQWMRDASSAQVLEMAKAIEAESDFPSMFRQAANIFGAAGRLISAGLHGKQMWVTAEQLAYRKAQCADCEHMKNDRCVLCGCPYKRKIRAATEACPAKPPRWLRITEQTS
jgi:hypothetical protein